MFSLDQINWKERRGESDRGGEEEEEGEKRTLGVKSFETKRGSFRGD